MYVFEYSACKTEELAEGKVGICLLSKKEKIGYFSVGLFFEEETTLEIWQHVMSGNTIS